MEHDDLGDRLIIYAEPRGELESQGREKFCMESCCFRAGIFTLLFPLYHLVELSRFLCIGAMESRPFFKLAYLLIFIMVFGRLALGAMKRRLIK